MNLAYRLRPKKLEEFVGQSHLVDKGMVLRRMIDLGNLTSIIFWGPPGSGKTSLAYIISKESKADFYRLSGVASGKDDLKKILSIAKTNKQLGKNTIVFIDEIHRWNKSQQDTLLPFIENGLIILIGATTENPSFEIISPLLSRCRVFILHSLGINELHKLIDRALNDDVNGIGRYDKKINNESRELIIQLSGGDARILLNALEIACLNYKEKVITKKIVLDIFQTKYTGIYDKKADEHYNIISAFIKSMRGSDENAALYYLTRMLENGEDPKFIARRMIIFASEDIGLADRGALIQANEAFEAVNKVGMPEAQLILVHIVIYLSKAPKSRLVPNALNKAKKAVYEYPNEPVPFHLRNAPTKLMKELGYAKGYEWNEFYVGPKNKNTLFLPEKIKNKKFID
jgi:putative ATPase